MSAEEQFKKAEGKVNKMLFKDFEGAYECFQRAGAQFRLDKNYDRAGDAFMRAGDCATKLKNPGEACQAYTDAANCYKKCDMKKAAVMLNMAIQINIENNRLGGAARLEKDFAEALEADGQLEASLEHYRQALKFFEAEDQTVSANTVLGKIAKITGDLDRWEQCAELYEQLGAKSVDGPLKHQAKEHYLRATLCRLALCRNDNRETASDEAAEALDSYATSDIYLRNTREMEFLLMLCEAVREEDVDKFELAVSMATELRMIDDWKTHVLLVIKRNMEDQT